MAKIGWGELVIILVIALLVLGPERLPQVGRALGKAVRSVKKYVSEASKEFDEIDELKNIKADVEGIRKDLRTMGSNLERSFADDAATLESDMKKAEEDILSAVESEPETPAETTTQEENAT